MSELNLKKKRSTRRIKRVRRKVMGTLQRPRLAFKRSNRHIYAQLIDDIGGKTIGMVATTSKEFSPSAGSASKKKSLKNSKTAIQVAEAVYEMCSKKKIKQIVFDRRGKRYHTVLKSFADKLREKGIEF
ncbi:MAG: 50S ribosomal protein L18 [Spirochaetes bacterium]|nr:50S ribosomal protein L18 [Spirochaetota bacterium]